MFDALEKKWQNTDQANLINELYQGKMKDYVRCLEVIKTACLFHFSCKYVVTVVNFAQNVHILYHFIIASQNVHL